MQSTHKHKWPQGFTTQQRGRSMQMTQGLSSDPLELFPGDSLTDGGACEISCGALILSCFEGRSSGVYSFFTPLPNGISSFWGLLNLSMAASFVCPSLNGSRFGSADGPTLWLETGMLWVPRKMQRRVKYDSIKSMTTARGSSMNHEAAREMPADCSHPSMFFGQSEKEVKATHNKMQLHPHSSSVTRCAACRRR